MTGAVRMGFDAPEPQNRLNECDWAGDHAIGCKGNPLRTDLSRGRPRKTIFPEPHSSPKCNTSGGVGRFSCRMMLRIGQEAATVPLLRREETAMPEGFRHLTHGERCQIGALKESGLSYGDIAARLGRDRSSVWRELRRNGGDSGYSPGEAQGMAEARRSAASSVPRKMTAERWAHVEGCLAEGWSPEQVAGRLRLEGGWAVGRQWIYERLKADRKAGGELFLLLRRRGKKPNWRGGRHSGRGHIPGRVDISERPEEVERKERVGDWEADTIIGKGHSGAVVSLVDRASKYTYLQRVDRRTSAEVSAAMLAMLRSSAAPVHTITADNGKEFAGHAGVAEALKASFYFATPYHSWERGLNEHTNGLVRQYLPKGTDLRAVGDDEVKGVQDRLNARPRRVLGYRTPAEVFRRARPP